MRHAMRHAMRQTAEKNGEEASAAKVDNKDDVMPSTAALRKMGYNDQLRALERFMTNKHVERFSTGVGRSKKGANAGFRASAFGSRDTPRGYQAPSHVGNIHR